MNEVLLGMPLPKGMMANFKRKLLPKVCRDVIVLGKKYSGDEAK
jgi:hypothetical protein